MFPMRFRAGDVQSRVKMARLLTKMEDQPEIRRKLGLEDATKYPEEMIDNGSAAVAEKEAVEC